MFQHHNRGGGTHLWAVGDSVGAGILLEGRVCQAGHEQGYKREGAIPGHRDVLPINLTRLYQPLYRLLWPFYQLPYPFYPVPWQFGG